MISNNQKAELTNLLVSKLDLSNNNNNQSNFDIDLIDAFYLLNNLREPPLKYGKFASMVLETICRTSAREIHLIFHKDQSPSPGDIIMKKRRELFENSTTNFRIMGPNQERNCSLKKCLISSSFRDQIVQFFVDHWSQDEACANILGEKRLFVSFGKNCYLYSNQYEKGKSVVNFENNHFEIETKMILHLSKTRAHNIRVKIERPDTILVYLLYHMKLWPNEKQVWIETGDISKNTLRLINVRQIFRLLTPAIIDALPGWYAFTGCLHEPSFYGKGRKICFKTLEKSIEFQNAFAKFGTDVQADGFIEQYTCRLYGSKDNDVNSARVNIFNKGYSSANAVNFKKNGMLISKLHSLSTIYFNWK